MTLTMQDTFIYMALCFGMYVYLRKVRISHQTQKNAYVSD